MFGFERVSRRNLTTTLLFAVFATGCVSNGRPSLAPRVAAATPNVSEAPIAPTRTPYPWSDSVVDPALPLAGGTTGIEASFPDGLVIEPGKSIRFQLDRSPNGATRGVLEPYAAITADGHITASQPGPVHPYVEVERGRYYYLAAAVPQAQSALTRAVYAALTPPEIAESIHYVASQAELDLILAASLHRVAIDVPVDFATEAIVAIFRLVDTGEAPPVLVTTGSVADGGVVLVVPHASPPFRVTAHPSTYLLRVPRAALGAPVTVHQIQPRPIPIRPFAQLFGEPPEPEGRPGADTPPAQWLRARLFGAGKPNADLAYFDTRRVWPGMRTRGHVTSAWRKSPMYGEPGRVVLEVEASWVVGDTPPWNAERGFTLHLDELPTSARTFELTEEPPSKATARLMYWEGHRSRRDAWVASQGELQVEPGPEGLIRLSATNVRLRPDPLGVARDSEATGTLTVDADGYMPATPRNL